MNKLSKMKLCDWVLIAATIVTLASSIQLEVTGSRLIPWVWIHIFIATVFIILIAWHLYLHFQWRNWVKMILKQKSPVTRWLGLFYILTIITALIAIIEWFCTYSHSTIGGIHGKIGFIFVAIVIGHTIKRLKSPVLKRKR